VIDASKAYFSRAVRVGRADLEIVRIKAGPPAEASRADQSVRPVPPEHLRASKADEHLSALLRGIADVLVDHPVILFQYD
jgi:hypothetical protein